MTIKTEELLLNRFPEYLSESEPTYHTLSYPERNWCNCFEALYVDLWNGLDIFLLHLAKFKRGFDF